MRKIKLFLYLIPFYISGPATAQSILSICSNTTATDTIGTFSDSGGPNGFYNVNENCTLLIQPPCVDSILLKFTQFSTELNHDSLMVYDGTTTAAPLLLSHSGNTIPGNIIGTSGALLIVWQSDSSVNDSGFIANWSIVSKSSSLIPFSCFPFAQTVCCGVGFTQIKINPQGNTGIGIDNYSSIYAYSDYSCDSMTIYTNSDYNFRATIGGSYDQQVSAWIDFNNDGTFDSINERIINIQYALTFCNDIFQIDSNNISSNVIGQQIRMRFITDYMGNPPISPCVNPVFGEVEDYAVIIQRPLFNSINSLQQEFSFSIYPNPTDQNTLLEYTLSSTSVVTLEIFDLFCKKITSLSENDRQSSGKHIYTLNNIPAGVYFAKLKVDGNISIGKVIRQ